MRAHAAGYRRRMRLRASASCRAHAPAGCDTARAYPGPLRASPAALTVQLARRIHSKGRLSSSLVSPAWETNRKGRWLASSRVTCVAMLRQEELVQQPVDLQQRVAIQPQTVLIQGRVALSLQFLQRAGESIMNIDAEFPLKVFPVHVAQFHL